MPNRFDPDHLDSPVRARVSPARTATIFALLLIAPLAGAGSPAATLSIDAQVACQAAIEDVRWSHMIWPESNPGPKPARSEVLPADTLRTRVEDRQRMAAVLAYQARLDAVAKGVGAKKKSRVIRRY